MRFDHNYNTCNDIVIVFTCFCTDELRNKSLPIWLRKELEELELKKFKEAERKAEIKEGENTVRGSWWEELEDDNEIEREVMENDTPPKYRKRIRMTDSPPERV